MSDDFVRIPWWLFYGLWFGGLIPAMTSFLPFWSVFPGMALGVLVMYVVDRRSKHRPDQ